MPQTGLSDHFGGQRRPVLLGRRHICPFQGRQANVSSRPAHCQIEVVYPPTLPLGEPKRVLTLRDVGTAVAARGC
jgi:hypothetical protein